MYPLVLVINVLQRGLLLLADPPPKGRCYNSGVGFKHNRFVLCPPSAPARANTNTRSGAEDRRASRLQEGCPQDPASSSSQPGEMTVRQVRAVSTPGTKRAAQTTCFSSFTRAPLFCDAGPHLLPASWDLVVRL